MAAFDTTRWTLVLAAREDSPEAHDALSELCKMYWPPIFAYLIRRGYDRDEAADLAQEFFTRMLEKNTIAKARRERGKFRTFLLTSLNNFLHSEWNRRNAKKRGGGQRALSLDTFSDAQIGKLQREPISPDLAYDRQWALEVLSRAMDRLEAAQRTGPARLRFNQLKKFLAAGGERQSFAELAQELDATEGSLKVAAHRLRADYRECIREVVADTLPEGADANEEIRYLISVFSRPSSEPG